jgi:hypothetical protein
MKTLMLFTNYATLFLVLVGFFSRREERMVRERGAYSQDQFLEHFSTEAIPERILVEIYRYFQSLQKTKNFPVHPSDDLYKVYGVWNEDLDDAVVELARRCGCKTPTNETVKGMDRVQSIQDLAKLLSKLCS